MGKEVVRDERMQEDPHIIFGAKDRVGGYAGCNSFSGGFKLKEDYKLRISGVTMTTKMACIDMTIETEFVRVLKPTDSYLVKGDTLFLYRGMAPLARFEAYNLD